ncbi:phage major capsid protein [Escherichia coli]|nr:phage major capsid protein [Escherichia coli]
MKKLIELRQQKTALKNQMRSLLEKADSENRSLNAEEGKQFDELRAKADALDTEISRLESVADEERSKPGTGIQKLSSDELRNYIVTGDVRSLSTSTDSGRDGGYTVIPELEREVMRQLKANPNIDVSVDREKLASTIQKARGIPSQWVEMLTKRFNIWCQGATPWMGNGAWAECAGTFAEADLYGQECYAGLDLSSTSDISSVCYAFPVGKKIMLVSRHYLPEFQLQNPANKNRAIYRQWVKAGWIRTTPGDCIDYDRIRDDIMADAENFNIRLVGFDTWNATHLRTQLQGAGFEVEPFPQTYLRFSPAAKSFEVFVNRKVIVHRGDPVLAWSMSNVVMQSDANANIKPNKKKSSNKIDPSVAALMAFGTFQAEHEEFAFDMSDSHKERLAAFDGV